MEARKSSRCSCSVYCKFLMLNQRSLIVLGTWTDMIVFFFWSFGYQILHNKYILAICLVQFMVLFHLLMIQLLSLIYKRGSNTFFSYISMFMVLALLLHQILSTRFYLCIYLQERGWKQEMEFYLSCWACVVVAPSYSNRDLARSLLVFSIYDPKIKSQILTDKYKMIVQWFE